jgi:signal transduction histidine kinase
VSPEAATVPLAWVGLTTVVYVAASVGLGIIVGRGTRFAVPLMQAGLLLDGIFLAAAVALTGGTSSLLRFLAYGHVLGVTLLCSYRTGLKLTVWHTVLFLWVVQAIRADLVPGPDGMSAGGGGVALTVGGMWLLALGTAAFAAVSERELRRQKADLTNLSAMVARLGGERRAAEIPKLLLEELRGTFGFGRGVVLASPEGELELLAATDQAADVGAVDGLDPIMSRAWNEGRPQLVRGLDPAADPRLAKLLPGARNVLVVPLLPAGSHRLGVVAVERGGKVTQMRRWEVEMVAQFAAHAARALYGAWLTEDRQRQLETIQELELQLRMHNEQLETKVAERTAELRDAIRHLEEIDRQRRSLLEHVVRAAEDERRRIANDVHDDPVQKLVVVKMRLEMLQTEHPELTDLEEVHGAVRSTIQSMRRMLFDLSPPILDEEGLGPALEHFLENSPVPYEWSIEDHLSTDPSTQSRLILYRTAQEALTNVRKHAQAEEVRLTLEERDGGVWMEIEDDGVGFQPQEAVVAAPGHLGLAAMRERAEMAGGWCTLRSLPGAGTNLQVWLPRAAEEVPAGIDHLDDDELADVLSLQDRIA